MDDVTALADTARDLMRRHPARQASDPYPPEVRAALTELTDAMWRPVWSSETPSTRSPSR